MDPDDTDEQVTLYARRPQLATQMLNLGARPNTICAWSGLTTGRFKTVKKRHAAKRTRRVHYSRKALFNSNLKRSHAALLISVCELMKVIGKARGPEVAQRLPSLRRGEQMVRALKLFKRWVPEAEVDFEYGSHLMLGVVGGETLEMGQCKCGAAMLLDLCGAPRSACSFCQPRAPGPRAWGKEKRSAVISGEQRNERRVGKTEDAKAEGNGHGFPEREGRADGGNFKECGGEQAQQHGGGAEELDEGQHHQESEQQGDAEEIPEEASGGARRVVHGG